MPCRFASSGTVATSRSASRAILALNVASNFLRDLVISVLHRLRQSRTLHTLTFGPISGVHFNSTWMLLEFARSLERFAILSMNGSDNSLSSFHSSASASQYSNSAYSISFLASAARSRHMSSNAANCILEYIKLLLVAASLIFSLSGPTNNLVTYIDASVNLFPDM